MTHSHFDEEMKRANINGPRPSPLKLKNASHIIQKQPIPRPNQRQPIIIYTHSPKIIHTKPRDFMSLVQKLTGYSHSNAKPTISQTRPSLQDNNNQGLSLNLENSYTSSNTSDDNNCTRGNSFDDIKEGSTAVSPMNKGFNPSLAEMPLFTPNSNRLFCSSPQTGGVRPLDLVFPSPGLIIGSVSPSFLEFMKSFPET